MSSEHQAPRFCADCFKGTLRGDVEPRGTVETVHGLPTYVARPEPGREPAGVVVVLPDAFGWELLNTRALADAYAKRIPAVVLLPDMMNGYAFPASALVTADKLQGEKSWFRKYFFLVPLALVTMIRHFVPLYIATRPGVIVSRIGNFLRAVRLAPPSPLPPRASSSSSSLATAATGQKTVKIGVAGFCWGGKHAVQLTQLGAGPYGAEPLVDCAYTAHPSFLSLPGDLERAVLPLSVANGDDDMMMPRAKMAQAKELLAGKENCEIVEYPGAKHGFAVRPVDRGQADYGRRAEDQAVGWFRRWFGQSAEE
ncbi:dienelactone hydrolase family protein [Colletotrichum sublineola]|nr:dienelactone hydrolase family protein [Colletotrichum sublineola]